MIHTQTINTEREGERETTEWVVCTSDNRIKRLTSVELMLQLSKTLYLIANLREIEAVREREKEGERSEG